MGNLYYGLAYKDSSYFTCVSPFHYHSKMFSVLVRGTYATLSKSLYYHCPGFLTLIKT